LLCCKKSEAPGESVKRQGCNPDAPGLRSSTSVCGRKLAFFSVLKAKRAGSAADGRRRPQTTDFWLRKKWTGIGHKPTQTVTDGGGVGWVGLVQLAQFVDSQKINQQTPTQPIQLLLAHGAGCMKKGKPNGGWRRGNRRQGRVGVALISRGFRCGPRG
jgi:hypothetical protein